jgi:hypothetical protein
MSSRPRAAAARGSGARHSTDPQNDQDRGCRLLAGGLRRGAADPPGGAAAGLRASRRHPGNRRHLEPGRGHRLPAGDYDQAAELQRKRLEINKQLGDLDGIAAASWDLAQIDLARKDYEAALPRLMESFQIFGRLQRPDVSATAGNVLGQLLMAAGQTDEARGVLGDARAAAAKIGWADRVQQITGLRNSPPAASEDT